MSVVIHNVIVHRIIAQDEQLVVLPRAKACAVSPEIEQLAQQLNHIYNSKPAKGVGGFTAESNPPPWQADAAAQDDGQPAQGAAEQSFAPNELQLQLEQWLAGERDYVAFSHGITALLIHHLNAFTTPETGFLVLSHFQHLATDYLLIALLDTKEHVEITTDLEFNISSHLDVAKMQLAARIDITQYQTNPVHNRYVSFIKGRVGRKISDFFMHFLGCEELLDVKQQNQTLLTHVESYLDSEQMDPQEKNASRSDLVQYYRDKIDAGENISISDVAETLAKTDQRQDFAAFTKNLDAPLEQSFQPDRAAIKTLSKFSGQGGGVSLSFDRALLGESIHYNPADDTLVIKGLPPNLRDQLQHTQD